MVYLPENLAFEGGGVLGISYLGALHYLYQGNYLTNLKRIAGTSAGAVTACITSLNLPFPEMKAVIDTLHFPSILDNSNPSASPVLTAPLPEEPGVVFQDFNGLYRLLTKYGWYSTDYFYHWIQEQIALQFDPSKKKPPYTFADFKDSFIHKQQRPFHDLYIIGTDLSCHTSQIFSYENSPDMEVALAVKISISIPLFFQAVSLEHLYCDGGVMWNYPINLFDRPPFQNTYQTNPNTLGLCFVNPIACQSIANLLDYIFHLYQSLVNVQKDQFQHAIQDQNRSIQIPPGDVSFIDFSIMQGDSTYDFLYEQGYQAARNYFTQPKIPIA